jgi:hypothetical protein
MLPSNTGSLIDLHTFREYLEGNFVLFKYWLPYSPHSVSLSRSNNLQSLLWTYGGTVPRLQDLPDR